MAGKAQLRFNGDMELVSETLPKIFVLDPALRREVNVGRDEVPAGGLLLDCDKQKLMISRIHAKLVFLEDGRWKLKDQQSTNGIIHNGVRVSEVLLAHGDSITFGGARSTALGSRPGPQALKSIYSYSFENISLCKAESCPSTRSKSEDPESVGSVQATRFSVAGSGGGARGGGAAGSAAAENGARRATAQCVSPATRAVSKGKGKDEQGHVGGGAGTEDDMPKHPPKRCLSMVRAPTLPLQHLRDENGELDHRLLGRGETWPTCDASLTVSLQGEEGKGGLHVGQLVFNATEMSRSHIFDANKKMRAVFIPLKDGWRADRSTDRSRGDRSTMAEALCIYYSDDPQKKDPHSRNGCIELSEPIAFVEALPGDHQTFWTLVNLAKLVEPEPADAWGDIWVVDDQAFLDSEKRMPRVLLDVHMAQPAEGSAKNAMATITIDVSLGPAAFLFDRRLSAGATLGRWIDEEYGCALVGERSGGVQDAFKALRRLLVHMSSCLQKTGLCLGPDSCEATMNRYAGVREADVLGKQQEASGEGGSSRSSSVQPTAADFDLDQLLESVSRVSTPGTAAPLSNVTAECLSGLRENCNLHPFQQDGIAWMVSKEEDPDWLSLHPSWIQLRTPKGTLFYLHRWTGELSSRFFTSPLVETCGGMLCDDVGLGKSVQLLGLLMARPAPPDFPVQVLPTHTTQPLTIKGTLIVAPAALLPQWEGEIRKHTKPGALRTCTYLGIGSGRKKAAAAAAAVSAGGVGGRARGGGSGEPSGVDDYEPRITRQSVRAAEATTPQYEVLARTQRHLFESAATSREEDHLDDGQVEVENCDIILCSFETLRDELRKTQRNHGGMDLPLGTLGFWRIILDEAQLVSQSTSRAAQVCSGLWRRHAWVATGTPINSKAADLHGLLAFLGTAPFKEEFHFNHLLLRPYQKREPTSLYKMRTLLRALCLRRSKLDPTIAAQIAIPPLTWETRLLSFSDPERAIYSCWAEKLRRSHSAFSRATKKHRARLLGQLNGNLTRLRQVTCHPSVINEARTGASFHAPAHSSDGSRLPQTVVLARLIATAAVARDVARAACLKARVTLYVAQQRAAKVRSVDLSDNAAEVVQEIEECEVVSRREADMEADSDAAKTLRSNVDRWQRVRLEVGTLVLKISELSENKKGHQGDKCCEIVDDEDTLQNVAGRSGKRKPEGGTSKCVGKKQKLEVPAAVPSSVALENASKALVRAEAQERQSFSAHAYLSSLRSEQAASSSSAAAAGGDEEAEDMDNGEDGCARGKAKAHSVETCPICLDERGASFNAWSITACGHSGCHECMTTWLAERKVCPCCKKHLDIHGLYEVEAEMPDVASAHAAASSSSSAAAKAVAWRDDIMKEAVEEYGTKIAALVQELGAVHAGGGKSVVFSAWTRLLKLADSALSAHGLTTASLVGSPAAKREALEAFSGDASVLLVPLFGGASGAGGGGAAGLTLTQASVAVLLEPALQPGIERQAAGRIARIGQSKQTRLIRLIIDKSIEKKILEWQQIRLAHGASADNTLTLNDFAALVG